MYCIYNNIITIQKVCEIIFRTWPNNIIILLKKYFFNQFILGYCLNNNIRHYIYNVIFTLIYCNFAIWDITIINVANMNIFPPRNVL